MFTTRLFDGPTIETVGAETLADTGPITRGPGSTTQPERKIPTRLTRNKIAVFIESSPFSVHTPCIYCYYTIIPNYRLLSIPSLEAL